MTTNLETDAPKPRYRGDVDGLRALAVALVVLYHLRVSGVSGGFVGVDVFFVISGFVVTRLLVPRIQAGTFSLRTFYINRFWRLQPAFLLMSVVTLALSYFLLAPADLLITGRSALAGATLSANIFFWLTTDGYGTALADQQPLIHTWSLAVEEQFYLIWPPVVLVLARTFKTRRTAVWTCVLLGLLGLSEWFARTQPAAAYYLLPSRLFELGLGAGLVALEARPLRPEIARVIAPIGLTCVVAAGLVLREGMPFPGFVAALPCAGAALLIHAGTANNFVSRLLETSGARALGRMSYSLYLWHWPPIAFANYLGLNFTPTLQLAIGLGALASSYLSLRYWEGSTRQAPRGVFRGLTYALGAVLALGLVLVLQPNSKANQENKERNKFEESAVKRHLDCLFGARNIEEVDRCGSVKPARAGDKRLLVWGDSHARIYGRSLAETLTPLGWTPTVITVSGCPPVFGVHREDRSSLARYCNEALGDKIERFIDTYPFDAVLLVGRFSLYEKGYLKRGKLQKTTHFISDATTRGVDAQHSGQVLRRNLEKTVLQLAANPQRRILFALPTPTFEKSPEKSRAAELFMKRSAYEADRRFSEQFAADFHDMATVIDPIESFCDDARCTAGARGARLYDDQTHLSKLGRERLVPLIKRALETPRGYPLK